MTISYDDEPVDVKQLPEVTMHRRVWLGSCLVGASWTAGAAGFQQDVAPRFTAATLQGRVQKVTKLFSDRGIAADSEPIAKQVVLVESSGVVWPLISDESSRALFQDERLWNRKVELNVRKYEGLPWVQVVGITIENEGKMVIPEYYCDVCTISVRFPQVCPCCQGSMELRYRERSETLRNGLQRLEH